MKTDPLVRIGGVDIHEYDIRPLNRRERVCVGFGLAVWAVAMWLLMR